MNVTPDGSRFVVPRFDTGGARPTAVTIISHWRDELDRLLKRKQLL